jgi:anti-repressor protein
MNELIKIEDRAIGGDPVQTINARELHVFLEIGKDFSNWIKAQIERARLVDSRDYCVSEVFPQKGENSKGGRPSKEYHLTIEAGKHIAMMSGTDKGFEVREFFIECERRTKTNVVDIHSALADPASLRGMLLAYTEKVLALEAKVQEQAPKAQFHDAVAEAINCQSVQEVAKVLGTGQNRLFKFLRQEGLLMPNNLPYQQHIDAGYFRVVERQYNDRLGESHTYTRTLVTGKGLGFIQRRLSSREVAVG